MKVLDNLADIECVAGWIVMAILLRLNCVALVALGAGREGNLSDWFSL